MRLIRLLTAALLVVASAGCGEAPPPVTDKVAAAYEQGTTIQPRPDETIYFAFGDSYTGGSNMGGSRGTAENWVSRVGDQTRAEIPDFVAAERGVGGSGYVARGPANTVFGEQVDKYLTPEADLVSVFGSVNDKDVPAADVGRASDRLLQAAKKIAPKAKIVVIGPPWVSADVPDNVLAIRDALAATAKKHKVKWVDPIGERWFFDNPELIGKDGVHPTDAGHAYMAKRIAPHLARALAQ